jgi:hypothetical protein
MIHRRLLTVLAIGAVLGGASAIGGAAGPAQKPLTSQEKAQKLLAIKGLQMSGQVRQVLEMAARGDRHFGADQSSSQQQPASQIGQSQGGNQESRQGMANVLVNNPGEDTHQTDQTTQSETAIGVSGRNVVVGFNDSQTALLFLTAGANLQGYAYSRDGGRSFTDAGALPNRPGEVNLGDPWLGTDRSGNFYFSNLITSLDPVRFGYVDVGVAKSTDGGRTFGISVRVDTQPEAAGSYMADKDALAIGRDPANASRDNIYVGWDDFLFDQTKFSFSSGLPVSHSYDGGATWQASYADKIAISLPGCGFQQYIGAFPIVDKGSGVVYLAAEKLRQDNPNCDFPPPALTASQVIFKSVDAGRNWSGPTVISNVVPAAPMDCFGFPCFQLGPHQFMRDLEFPSLAIDPAGNIYDTWNDGRTGKSHVLIARSTDGGSTWVVNPVTTGANDEMQPALSADASGLHDLYYKRNTDNTLDVIVANSTDGSLTWSYKRVTSQSFPGVYTVPQFDPIINPFGGYMGDYIANASDGSSQYFAWGDNRNTVTNFLWPQGRHDPDVFFASQNHEEGD